MFYFLHMSMFKEILLILSIVFFVGCSGKTHQNAQDTQKHQQETIQPIPPKKTSSNIKPAPKKPQTTNKTKQILIKQFNKSFIGEWFVLESTAQFNITLINSFINMTGKDVADDEKFIISRVNWEKKRIVGQMVMPSTNNKIKFSLSMLDRNTIECRINSNYQAVSIWKRKSSLMSEE